MVLASCTLPARTSMHIAAAAHRARLGTPPSCHKPAPCCSKCAPRQRTVRCRPASSIAPACAAAPPLCRRRSCAAACQRRCLPTQGRARCGGEVGAQGLGSGRDRQQRSGHAGADSMMPRLCLLQPVEGIAVPSAVRLKLVFLQLESIAAMQSPDISKLSQPPLSPSVVEAGRRPTRRGTRPRRRRLRAVVAPVIARLRHSTRLLAGAPIIVVLHPAPAAIVLGC